MSDKTNSHIFYIATSHEWFINLAIPPRFVASTYTDFKEKVLEKGYQ